MSLESLLVHVPPEHRAEVQRRYADFMQDSETLASEHIDSFAKVLSRQGLISEQALNEFLTYRALLVRVPADDEPPPAPEGHRYERMTVLGRGGMGEVFLGTEPTLKRTVAIKRLHPERELDQTQHRRFITEAQVTAQLDHPAIIPIYGLERDTDGSLAYAMKFVRGQTLAEYLREAHRQIESHGRPEGTHSLKARVATFVPVLNALAYAHRRGVIHRDLKPENIMVGRFGEVLVMDWGIARVLSTPGQATTSTLAATGAVASPAAGAHLTAPTRRESARDTAADPDASLVDASEGLTRKGTILGTPDFMSPEQARGEELDQASDQYALGLILQEVVTLAAPIPGRNPVLVLDNARRGVRAPFTKARERVPREIRAIIDKATAPAKADRYASVEHLADDVRRFLRDESVVADPDRGLRHVTRWIGNHRGTAMALGVALLVLIFAVAAFVAWRSEVALAAERQAARARERAITQTQSLIDTRAKAMIERLHGYEQLLTELTTSARIFLREPAPPSNVIVYQYRGGRRDPVELPDDAVHSKVYAQLTSFGHADFTAAPEVDRAHPAVRAEVDRLARLEPVLRKTLLASAGGRALMLSPQRATELVLQKGVPLVWSYFGTASGLSIGLPGTWSYEDSPGAAGYDARKEAWYVDVLETDQILWSSGVDENGLGLLMSLARVVRDERGELLGVAALDLAMTTLIDELLEIPELTAVGAEALLLDREGRVHVRSSQKDSARTMIEFAPLPFEIEAVRAAVVAGDGGHLITDDGRLASWASLGRVGLIYLVIGPEDAILAAVKRP